MRLIFAGTPEPAVVALEKLLASEHEVIAVLTRPDAPKGRGRTLHPSAVAALAEKHGIEVLKPATLKQGTEDGDAFRARLQQLAPDCVPVVAYGNLIPQDVLDMVEHGFVNLHFSLLPKYRGAAPVQAAIAAGESITGATTFRIDAGLDTGDILGMIEQPIEATDTADDLLTRLAYSGGDLLVRTISGLEAGSIEPRKQQGDSSHAAKILPADARIDWNLPAEIIDRTVRAVTPAPGAWTMLGDDRVKLDRLTLNPAQIEEITLGPGELHIQKKQVLVGTGTTTLALTRIQVPGKKMMNATDWSRGIHNPEGITFQ
ncbi:MAG: methionyl-tRNA formyltransferase [Corynebacterium sp.]|uniref:methionyl-tRNA formyltransferase n=1 Tax=Corynebacterium sp. TaxID=1720 RepID=UPI0026DB0729|nr:methionyl-tRNA formyltransferase [Corynebacterium sp.]MDO4760365.1 methionyl-tRNA formyltransferase [Corynebacterium sp.]